MNLWNKLFCAFFLGAVTSTSLPPLSFFPSVIFGFTFLIWLLDGCNSLKSRFLCGWSFGFGYFLCGMYWFAFPFLVNPEKFIFFMPFAVIGLPAALGIFSGLAAYFSSFFATTGWERLLSFSVFWVLMEWLRGNIFSGFPWNLIGYVWVDFLSISQVASFFGIYGLSLIAIIISVAPAELFQKHKSRWLMPVFALITLVAMNYIGSVRLNGIPNQNTETLVRLVQGNIAQKEKWVKEFREKNILSLIDLSNEVSFDKIDLIIWPETASTFFLPQDEIAMQLISNAIPKDGYLLTGSRRIVKSEEGKINLFNSLIILKSSNLFQDYYDKHHLVPFGEYVPMRSFLGKLGLEKLVPGTLDYSAGSNNKTMRLKGIPSFSPLVCYEAIFPNRVVDRNDRPNWLLAVSNDAWFGKYSGPIQHFQMSRLRAIEQGLPLVRVANTGITGVVDAAGRIKDRIPIGQKGIIDVYIPISSAPTLYSQFGDMIFFSICLFLLIFVFINRYYFRKN